MKKIDYLRLEKLYYKDKANYENYYNMLISNENIAYQLPVSTGQYPFFVVSSKEVLELIQDIYIRNNKLTRIYISLPQLAIQRYLETCLVEEVVQTNDIEGVHSTKKQLRSAMKSVSSKAKKEKYAGILQKYALIASNTVIPLKNSNDVRKLYDEIILNEIRQEDKPDGMIYRKDVVSVIGKNETAVHTGITPEADLIDFMDKILDWAQNANVPNLVKISAFHYLFAFAHPFYDGNGRMARFLSSYMLSDTLNYFVCFRLSHIINEQKTHYYKAFTETENRLNRGDLTYFVISFLSMVYDAIETLILHLGESKAKLDFFRERMAKLSSIKKGAEHEILDMLVQNTLFSDVPITASEMSKTMSYSHVWIRKHLNDLCEKGYASKEKNGKSWYYVAVLNKLN